MKTRIIHTKFWTDSYIRKLSTKEKFYYFYLITNEFINVLHIFELPSDIASLQTKIPVEEINQINNKFKEDGKIDFINEYIYLVNADKYCFYKGIKNNQRKLRLLIEMSDEVFSYFKVKIEAVIKQIIEETNLNTVTDKEFITLLNRVIHRGIDKDMGILLINQNTKNENKKTETRIEKPETRNSGGYQQFKSIGEILKRG